MLIFSKLQNAHVFFHKTPETYCALKKIQIMDYYAQLRDNCEVRERSDKD